MSNGYLLDIAIILLFTKVFGLATRKFKLPQVVGALIAGLVMGPAVLNIVHESDFIGKISELGVIVLMFNAGLNSDIRSLKKSAKDFLIIAMLGVLIPLIAGTMIAFVINKGSSINVILENIFVGSVLTATSVSITVETLNEMGKIKTKAANAIIGAAIVDDVLGIIVLTIITGFTDGNVNFINTLLKITVFFVFIYVVDKICENLFSKWVDKYNGDKRRFVIVSFVICLLLSYVANEYFGIADITGAFAAGVILSRNKETLYLQKRFDTLSYILLTPIFFANIGINMTLPTMDMKLVIFTIGLILTAMLSKVIGCGIGAKLCGYDKNEILQIGVGMIPRGEVALVIASKGMKMGVMNNYFSGPIIIMVVVCAITAPMLLKFAFNKN